MIFSRVCFLHKVVFFVVGVLLVQFKSVLADASSFVVNGSPENVVVNGNPESVVVNYKSPFSGTKKLTTGLTEVASTVLTVDFSTETGSSLVNIIVFGDIPGGDVMYEATLYLGTGNSKIHTARRNVSAGTLPEINVTFVEGVGTATVMIRTGVGQSVTNPVIFYTVSGAKIKDVK